MGTTVMQNGCSVAFAFNLCTQSPMRKNEPVSKIMSSTLQTVHDGERISKLRNIFEQSNIHHLPVVSGKKLVGIVSWNDYMRISFGEADQQETRSGNFDDVLDHTYSLPDVMTTDPVTIPSSGTIRDAARLLGQGDFHSLPVVDGEDLVGIITSSDLIRFLADQ